MSKKSITGYAAIFGAAYNMNTHDEVIWPGCFSRTDFTQCRLLRNHITDQIMGRIGVNLEVRPDEKGLFFHAQLPKTALADETAGLIRDGIITQTSWGFSGVTHRWEVKNGRDLRVITGVAETFDVSPVVWPANPATWVQTNSAEWLQVENTPGKVYDMAPKPAPKAPPQKRAVLYDPVQEEILFRSFLSTGSTADKTAYDTYIHQFNN
jgi:HK97 family phage prohead protease